MYRRNFIYIGVVRRHLAETAREASGLGVATGSGAVNGVRDNGDSSLQGGGGVADLVLGGVVLIIILRVIALDGLASDGSVISTVGLGSLGDNSNIDSGGRSSNSNGLGGALAVARARATVVGTVSVTVAGTLGAIVLTLASAVAVVTAGGRTSLINTLDGLGNSASGGLSGSGSGVILGGTVALGAVISDLRASRDGQSLLDGLVDSGGNGLLALGKGDNLVGGVV